MAVKASAPKLADFADALIRKEVARILKGPVAERMAGLIPPLASQPDPFATVMESPELLEACLKLFTIKRDHFAEFLIDDAGSPVTRDDVRLKCGRSVDEVIGMAVRQGMRSYAEKFFGDPVVMPKTPLKPVEDGGAVKAPPRGWYKLLDVSKLATVFRASYGSEKLLPKTMTKSGRFYNAIKGSLDYAWQVRFFPIYVLIPTHVFDKLGVGITRMDSEERLQRLSLLAMSDINKAEQVINDPVLFREMIDHNVLASKTINNLGEAGFESLHGALAHLTPQQKWDALANHDTATRLYEDKRVTKQDITALADYLPMLNEYALDAIFDLKLSSDQMKICLETAEQQLGPRLFGALFGPIQESVSDDADEQQKVKRYRTFTQTALRGLTTAVKQLDDNLRRTGGEGAIGECLTTVCRTRRPDLEKELKKLAPA